MSAPTDGGFSLLCWNVLADRAVVPGWYPGVAPDDLRGPTRRRRLIDALRARAADVMALQEVQPDLLPALRAAFPEHGLAFAPHAGHGLAVLVRGRTPWSRPLDLPGGRRRALLVTLPCGATLANVHLKWSGPPVPGRDRPGLRQMEAVLGYASALVVGDFNAFPAWPERRLALARGYVERGPIGPTCNVKSWLQPLDAVLTRPGWTARASPLPTLSADTPLPSPSRPSDHLPLEVRLAPPAP